MTSELLHLIKKWWFWTFVLAICSIPKYDGMSFTGEYYECGVPFLALYVKHGHMGVGGKLSEGVLYIPDGSPPLGEYRVGWFIQANPIGIGFNAAFSLLLIYALSALWQTIRHANQNG